MQTNPGILRGVFRCIGAIFAPDPRPDGNRLFRRRARRSGLPISSRSRRLRLAMLMGVVPYLCGMSSPANALFIDWTFAGGFAYKPGEDRSLYQGVLSQATDIWENFASAHNWDLVKDYRFDVTFDTRILPNTYLGFTYNNSQTAEVNTDTGTFLWKSATIAFNTNLFKGFFWDTTPEVNEEFNAGIATETGGAKGKYDALTLAVHELGHALGFMGATGKGEDIDPLLAGIDWTAYSSFADNLAGANFVYDYLPSFKGNTVGMGGFYHLSGTHPNDLMLPYMGESERTEISALDGRIIADAFHLVPIPEPESYAMLLAGLGLLGIFARRRKH